MIGRAQSGSHREHELTCVLVLPLEILSRAKVES